MSDPIRVVIVDDLLATGGTAAGALQLIRGLGADVAGVSFVVELAFLGGPYATWMKAGLAAIKEGAEAS